MNRTTSGMLASLSSAVRLTLNYTSNSVSDPTSVHGPLKLGIPRRPKTHNSTLLCRLSEQHNCCIRNNRRYQKPSSFRRKRYSGRMIQSALTCFKGAIDLWFRVIYSLPLRLSDSPCLPPSRHWLLRERKDSIILGASHRGRFIGPNKFEAKRWPH